MNPALHEHQAPPTGLFPALRKLGPGMVLAGSIVGSGELIATTTTGARAGFWLLWLIVLGCLVKVFAQVELGRSAIGRGRSGLAVLDELPGPRARASWAVWAWVMMTVLTLAQQGGIVGAIGSTLAMSAPLTDAGAAHEALAERLVELEISAATGAGGPDLQIYIADAQAALESAPPSQDPLLWAGLTTLLTCVLLGFGRYRMIQTFSAVTVAAFTLLTVVTVALLQLEPEWAVQGAELRQGLSFRLPPPREGVAPVATALATFGMIGVGASELVTYPYWCLEKGYARWTGVADGTPAWGERARGWLRIMRLDAWLSAVVYTFATVAFYLLGAAVLGRIGLDPGKDSLVRTLGSMYEPVFGSWARPVFLAGAFCVLYSTFFVASAGVARVATDAGVFLRLVPDEPASRQRWVRGLSVLFPLISFGVYAFVRAPLTLVLAGGVAQALMLPILGAAALHQRFGRTPAELRPSKVWDIALVLSCAGLLIAGGWTLVSILS